MSLIFATQLTAVATLALAVFALAAAILALLAWRKQSREVSAIEQQLQLQRDQADQERAQRRRAQASLVYVLIEPRPFNGDIQDMREAACIYNTSRQPVYDIALMLDNGTDQRLLALRPGETYDRPGLGTDYITRKRPVSIRFRDSFGIYWLRDLDGQLSEES